MAITGIHFPISMVQAEFLIDHIDAVRPITANSLEASTRNSMLARKLIRFTDGIINPKGTVLTDKGREVVCAILGHYADQLVRTRVLTERVNIQKMTEEEIRAAIASQVNRVPRRHVTLP